MKSAVAGARDDPALMQYWSRLISIELSVILGLDNDRYTLRSSSDRSRTRTRSSNHHPPLRHDFRLHTARVAPEVEALDTKRADLPGQISVAMEARRRFSAKVLATITDVSAENYPFQSIHHVSVDRPDEEMASSRSSGTASCSCTRSCSAKRCSGS